MDAITRRTRKALSRFIQKNFHQWKTGNDVFNKKWCCFNMFQRTTKTSQSQYSTV